MSQMLISITLSCDGERSLVAKLVTSHCQEKLLALIILYPYRKPTQVVEASSLSERTLVKELGKMAP